MQEQNQQLEIENQGLQQWAQIMEKELKEALLHFQTIMKEKQVDKEQLKSYKQTIDML